MDTEFTKTELVLISEWAYEDYCKNKKLLDDFTAGTLFEHIQGDERERIRAAWNDRVDIAKNILVKSGGVIPPEEVNHGE